MRICQLDPNNRGTGEMKYCAAAYGQQVELARYFGLGKPSQ